MNEEDIEDAFSGPEPKSSAGVLAALKRAEREFNDWLATCKTIDEVYSLGIGYYVSPSIDSDGPGWSDREFDLFWSSYEILKPAVYAKPPIPAVAPLFQDNRQLYNITAEMLERVAISTFKVTGIDDVMTAVRDDLLFDGRGVMWITYEKDSDGQRVCSEHKDRTDFLHEPARKWSEVGWVAGAAWMTKSEMRKRFRKTSGDAYQNAKFMLRRSQDGVEERQTTKKAKVWEVWHRADNKVYWVTEGVDVLLDSDEPHLKLSGFFPCPRPAFGTLRRRSLVPVPDYRRYAVHFNKIGELTARIHLLLDKVRLKGLIAAGGDIGDAVEELIRSDDDQILIPVPGAAMMATGGAANIVSWIPLKEIAEAIQGLIAARAQLIDDFYQLSGISDIMRGATEAEETLGAQQLKTQYGSVRVRCKIDELQRVAAEAVKIAAEIISENFSKETLLEMSQMEVHTKADIEKRIKGIEAAAKQELEALGQKAREAAQQQMQGQQGTEQPDPAQAQQMLQQAQQQIVQKYAPMLHEAEQQVPIEDVMKLLRDSKARNFTFEIETDSTILTDEMQEKQSRNEFLTEFTNASQGLTGLMAMGEQGAALAGEMLKFVLAPYRAGRQLSGAIDKFIDAAPEMAAKAQAAQGGGENEELIKAQQGLADAEKMKAKAAMEGVKSKAALAQADNERKMAELQQKAMADQQRAQQETEKLQVKLAEMGQKNELQQAQINKLTADTAKILASIGLDERKQQLSEYTAANQAQAQQVDQQLAVEGAAADQQFREREHQRADHGEQRADRQQEFTEESSDRQMSLAERQAMNEGEE
jgi:hypothetical protein